MMSKSSEDVLLAVSHVKNKKCDGMLYMMSERMAWMPATKETFTISYNYVDIKGNVLAFGCFWLFAFLTVHCYCITKITDATVLYFMSR